MCVCVCVNVCARVYVYLCVYVRECTQIHPASPRAERMGNGSVKTKPVKSPNGPHGSSGRGKGSHSHRDPSGGLGSKSTAQHLKAKVGATSSSTSQQSIGASVEPSYRPADAVL